MIDLACIEKKNIVTFLLFIFVNTEWILVLFFMIYFVLNISIIFILKF